MNNAWSVVVRHNLPHVLVQVGEHHDQQSTVSSKLTPASADSIPAGQRAPQPGQRGIISRLLSEFLTSTEIRATREAICPTTRAMIVMISDGRRIPVVEIKGMGRLAVRSVRNGVVARTNDSG